MSHLLQMRGLKPKLPSVVLCKLAVASFTDAWIETPLTWVVLLPFLVASFTDAWIETGLGDYFGIPSLVASFTDAWIETSEVIQRLYVFLSHLLQMRGLKLN